MHNRLNSSFLVKYNRLLLLLFLTFNVQLYPQDVPQYAPISKKEWALCEEFIQKKADDFFRKGVLTITPRKDLPYPIEKDPETGLIFIHLKDHPKCYLGKGGNKIVTKSILYSHHACIVARCEANHTGKTEAEILKKLHDARGIDHLYSMIPRANDHYDLFVEYANKKTMCRAPYGKLHLSTSSLLSVLFDINAGLIGIHEKGYLHRDIKKTNIFLYTKNGKLHGMIGDLGCAIPIKALPNERFCISNENTPPEIYQKPFCEINRIQADTYSLGVLFYMLILEKRPPWQKYIRKGIIRLLSENSKINRLNTIQTLYEQGLREDLPELKGARHEAAKLAFSMLHPDPTKRPSLLLVQKRLKVLMQ